MTRFATLALSALAACLLPGAALAQADDQAAQQMITNPNPSTFNVYGVDPKPKSVKDDSVQGGRALKVKVTGKGNPWDIGVSVPITKAIKAGDKIEMMFFAKFEQPAEGETSAKLAGGIQLAQAPYSSFMTGNFDLTTEWKLYTLTGTADRDYPLGSVNVSFQPNTGKHVVAFGIVAVFDKGQ